ncbi:MAG: UDP-N-acetylmuramoyl-tripeptide--D-alanyl-D-alanine ligase [Anaerolineae bacterium]|jgi:UDP-N-acetylmuramoyl-tripeptide--D-alanyl-D-alanine ligase
MLTLAEVWLGITGQTIEDRQAALLSFSDVVIDSRLATPQSLFVALRGPKDDGHRYVNSALEAGAAAALIDTVVKGAPLTIDTTQRPFPALPSPLVTPFCLLVEDALGALQDIAGLHRRQFDVRVVGITGSVGKTTTKEAVHSVLSRSFPTLKSEESYNNEIGVPLTLLRLEERYKRVVVELGMYALGEIAHLADIALPQVGVVTNVTHSHLERLGSLERIAQAKAELVEALPPDGIAILNGDDPHVKAMAELTEARVFCYGLAPDNDLWASHVESRGLDGVRFQMHFGRETVHVKIPLLGRHSVHTALAAAAVGLVEGQPWGLIVAGLRDIEVQLRLLATPGVNGSTLIDDSYNSSPASSLAALNLLAELKGRTIAVLGDMLELGSYEEEGHRKVGRRVAEVVDKLVTVGELGALIGREAVAVGMDESDVFFAQDNDEAVESLRNLVTSGDLVLIKGSRGMHMEDIVAELGEK